MSEKIELIRFAIWDNRGMMISKQEAQKIIEKYERVKKADISNLLVQKELS